MNSYSFYKQEQRDSSQVTMFILDTMLFLTQNEQHIQKKKPLGSRYVCMGVEFGLSH
jgi:hypothetical protein